MNKILNNEIFIDASEGLKHFSKYNFGRYQFIIFCTLSMQQRRCQMKRFGKKKQRPGHEEIQAIIDMLQHV
jgi:hypothetical protein